MADATLEAVRDAALWFEAGTDGLGPLLDAIGDASLVLIGEASHGTHEFYRIRADLTAALIERKGFNVIAAEADWPDAYRANRWVRLMSGDADAPAALSSFTRFPRWMWRNEVLAQLVDLRARATDYMNRDGFIAEDDYLFAEQNARLVRNAEEYYRSMFGGRTESWNLRDTHMMETLDALITWTRRRSGVARAVVWAHNSHLGDARATQMGEWGELSLGQLARQRYGRDAYLVGFTTHTGTVTAARDWDEPAERRQVRPSMTGSYERLFHDLEMPRFLVLMGEEPVRSALKAPRLERAIGVVYKPETERASHYFQAQLSEQFDAVIHIDTTTALNPLERWSREDADLPETYPTGV